MHYCCLVFTKSIPTLGKLNNLMRPFNCECVYFDEEGKELDKPNYKCFSWDWFEIGGRYNSLIKMKLDETYKYYGDRVGKKYISKVVSDYITYSRKEFKDEQDLYSALGYRDGYLRVDGCSINQILNKDDVNGYCLLSEDGDCSSREFYDGKNFIDTEEEYEKKRAEMFDKYKDGFLTIVDIHD